jgi:hypothetical protein
MRKTLESIRMTPNGKSAQGTMQIEGNVAEMLHSLLAVQRVETRIPEPEPKVEKK